MTFKEYFNNGLNDIKQSKIKEAMTYSLFSNGKMLRSTLLLEMTNAYKYDVQDAYSSALALEMIHTYSLIHDDLPAMDDDDLRRGRNTCHIEFDEATAILAGDGLLTEAFNTILKSELSADKKIKLVAHLSQFAGANGMILGQCLDMEANNVLPSYEYMKDIHKNKTGKLFALSFMMSAIISGNEQHLSTLEEIGYTLGLAFQIQDDIFEITKTTDELGKNTNSDATNDKMTINKFFNLSEATNLMNKCYNESIEMLDNLNIDSVKVKEIIENIRNRNR